MKILLQEGAGIDAVSCYEARFAEKLGFSTNQILFSGNNITVNEIQECIKHGWIFNAEALHNIETYGHLKQHGQISLRVNLSIGAGHHSHCITSGEQSKFGIYHDQLGQAFELVKAFDLKLIGLHVHVGAGVMESEPFILSLKELLKLSHSCPNLQFIDIGGGIGIPYHKNEQEFALNTLGKQIQNEMKGYEHLELKMEPGRYLVAESGVLLATVNGVKKTPKYQFVGVDTGMNHLLRPAMYGSYHQIEACSYTEGDHQEVVIAGNICETGDIFNQDSQGAAPIFLPTLKVGDIIAIRDCGAYGYSMSSTYNMRPRPAEVLIDNHQPQLIRKRETYHDLLTTLDI